MKLELPSFAIRIIKDHPELKDEVNNAYETMCRCIKEGEAQVEEEDLFYWYIHKLEKGEIDV
jgi:hypothetical protein